MFGSRFCGLARALDLVGERWALLLVRDLLISPKRFTDLRRGLPRIPSNILSTRLRELEQAGIVRRRALPLPESGVVYELTEYGQELDEVVLRLGRWGAARMQEPRAGEIVTPDSMVMALRAMFRPESAEGVHATFQVELGPTVFFAEIRDGELVAGVGPASEPDLVIAAGPSILALFAGEITAADAVATDLVALEGEASLLHTFGEIFRLDRQRPVPA